MRARGAQLPNQLDARRDVAPLIAAAHLQGAAVAIEQFEEIARLQQEIAELGVGDPFLVLEAPVHRLLLQHVVHGEMLPGVPQEPEQAERGEPVGIVDDARGIAGAIEVEEALELTADAGDVLLDLLV